MNEVLLAFEAIGKCFFDVRVLKGISFEIHRGQSIGLIGENGAGKSTLMNLLGGNLTPTSGGMRFEGQKFEPGSPREATKAGIAFIHQELNLFSNLSITENLFLTSFSTRGGLIKKNEARRTAEYLLQWVGLNCHADTLVESLSSGERQLVEIAKALSTKPKLLILDEPTTSLSSKESEHLFKVLDYVREHGIAMIYISHALEDVLRLCEELIVLRDGEIVGKGKVSEFSVNSCVSLMVGREIDQLYPRRSSIPKEADVLQAHNISQPGVVSDISLHVRQGEVVGISGLMGSGRTELMRILFGLDSIAVGTVALNGKDINGLSPRERIQKGMAFLTEDRAVEGLFTDASIADNITMVSLPSRTKVAGWLDGKRIAGDVRRIRSSVTLTASANNEQPVKTLSGGNQQKVVLAKCLLNEPKLLILDEPTRGIDIGAKFEIYQLILALADRGTGVLMISSEIEELMGLCDRILVMSHGEIRDEVSREDFDRERILHPSLHESTLTATR
ncbi:MAG: ribose transport system ATP-binding protein [Verrucomicrobiales bacterium]|jgi:ribose transport system ATP-binding protein